MSGGRKRAIPVLLPGTDRQSIPPFLNDISHVQFRSRQDAEALRKLTAGIEGRPDHPERAPGECPYRGLEPFEFHHAEFFAGRDNLIRELMASFDDIINTGRPRLLGLLGDSGSGKSSLARAGVLPKLVKATTPDRLHVIVKPGPTPLQNLALGLLEGPDPVTDTLRVAELKRHLAGDAQTLALGLEMQVRVQKKHSAVLLVDQFEELFSLCHADDERSAFVENLMHACSVADGRTLVVITLRADFYGACAELGEFGRVLNKQHVLVGPMTSEELEQAIEWPAQRAGYEVEPGLAALLVRDAQGEPGCLPLLQFTLHTLWRQRTGRRLTTSAYKEINGIAGALNQRADELYNQMSPEQRKILVRIFSRLVQAGPDGRLLRSRVAMPDLLPASKDADRIRATEDLIARLASAQTRLVTITASTTPEGEPFVELAHEALIRNWRRLREWLDDTENRAFLRWRQRFQTSVQNWCETNHAPGTYLLGALLSEARRWLRQRPDEFSREDAEFIQASIGRRRRELAQRAAAATIVIFALAGSIYEMQRRSQQDARISQARKLLESGNPYLGLVIALRGNMQNPTRESAAVLQEAFQAATAAPIEHGRNRIRDVSFSPDGSHIATASDDGTVYVWSLKGTRELGPLQLGSPVLAARLFADRLIALSQSGVIVEWAWPDGTERSRAELARVFVAGTFSPEGRLAATSADGQTCVWSIGARRLERCFDGIRSPLVMAWSAGSDARLALAGVPTEVALLTIRTGARASLPHPEGMISSANFNASGHLLATAARVGPARVWDVASGRQLGDAIYPNGQNVLAAALSSDGGTLATANVDGSLAMWSVRGRKPERIVQGATKRIASIALHGQTFLVASTDGKARIYEFENARLNRRACELEWHVRTSPDRRYLSGCPEYIGDKDCALDCRSRLSP
jgi:hypothetical protein